MKHIFTIVAALMLWVGAAPVQAACSEGRVELRGDWGTARFRVALADTPAERAQGLMHIEEMPRMSGMLFV